MSDLLPSVEHLQGENLLANSGNPASWAFLYFEGTTRIPSVWGRRYESWESSEKRNSWGPGALPKNKSLHCDA